MIKPPINWEVVESLLDGSVGGVAFFFSLVLGEHRK